ncbi:MAG TPA: hypothetical protein VGG39_34740 [Polyangiaceae bacterium]|jgi:hypothetical protein
MKPLAWTTALAVACALVAGACSSSSGGSNVEGHDAGLLDAGHPGDAAVPEDHAVADTAPGDAGASLPDAEVPDAASPDAGAECAPPVAQGPACGVCIATNCESAWCTCRSDPSNADDAGVTGCERFVKCTQNCVATDAGTPTACLQQICAVAPFSTVEQNEGQAFVDCLVQYCASECAQ